MSPTAFRSRPLPVPFARGLVTRLREEHRRQPFSTLDPRDSVRRAAAVVTELGAESTVYRGALDLRGAEVDHVWLEFDGRVLDLAFPLFVPDFIDALRDYVVGSAEAQQLEDVAAATAVEDRVVGEFPAPLRYFGRPVWSSRGV